MENKQEIILKLDASYKVKHEKYENFKTSFFKNVYKQAAENVKEIIDATKTDRIYEELREYSEPEEYTEPISSLIAFDGKRGSGKTSAMLSFCDFLRNFNYYDYDESKDKGVCDDLLKMSGKVSFTVLGCIDATLVSDSEELMGAILGKMLTAIEERERSNAEMLHTSNIDVRRLKTRLGEIYCSLKAQDIVRDDTSPGDVLEQLSRSWNQQRAFLGSVQKFNKYMSEKEGGKRQNYLVIPIDDVDMNLQNCYKLLEAVRKYMMVPNVIVLLAADDEQLETICVKAYHDGIGGEGGSGSSALPQKLALEYLEKLIPAGRRIYMPDLYREENLYRKQVLIMQDDNSGQTVKDAILLNVWKYVGIILNKDDENSHWLQPHSLRKLSNYVNSMHFLSETEEGGEGRDIFYKNINWFYEDLIKRYFNELKGRYNEESKRGGVDKALKEFENATLTDKLQRLVNGLADYGFNSKTDAGSLESIRSYGDLLSFVYMIKGDQKIAGVWQAVSFVLSLQMRRLIFAAEDYGDNQHGYERVMMFSKGDFWGANDQVRLKDFGKSQIGYQFDCDIPIAQLLADESVDMLHLLLLALQLGIKKDTQGKYKGYFRFGNFVNGVFDYKNEIEKIVELFKEEAQLQDKEEALKRTAEKLCGEFDDWQKKYKTTRVIPFDSAEFMFAVFDRLYGLHGVFGIFETEEQYVRLYRDALEAILEILSSYDKYYESIRDEYKSNSLKVNMNELKTEYGIIYGECPFIKYMRDAETSNSYVIARYIRLFKRSEVAEKKNLQNKEEPEANAQGNGLLGT